MYPNKEYLDSIAKKLDSFNRINGFNPQNNQMIKDDFDVMDYTGKVAIEYMKRRKEELFANPPQIDPLFRDHNI